MKKTFFLLVLLLLSIVGISKAQIIGDPDSLNLRDYGSWYLFPEDTCSPINLDLLYITNTNDYEQRGIFNMAAHVSGYSTCINVCTDFAQPYTVDTTVRIVGVSGYIGIIYYPPNNPSYQNAYKFYYEIRDSSLNNTLAQADVWPTLHSNYVGNQAIGYTEVFFDSPIDISNKFYVVFHTPDTVNPSAPLNIAYTVDARIWATTTNCVKDIPLERKQCDTSWEWQPITFIKNNKEEQIKVLYLFPILDSTYIGSSDLNTVRDISQFTHVFPNPANNEVNINCGYKIKTLQVFDEQGKLLFEKEVNAYNYQINLENYPTGTYLIKVLTNSGQTTKKVIKK